MREIRRRWGSQGWRRVGIRDAITVGAEDAGQAVVRVFADGQEGRVRRQQVVGRERGGRAIERVDGPAVLARRAAAHGHVGTAAEERRATSTDGEEM